MHPGQPGRDHQVERADAIVRGVLDVIVAVHQAMAQEGLEVRECGSKILEPERRQQRRVGVPRAIAGGK